MQGDTARSHGGRIYRLPAGPRAAKTGAPSSAYSFVRRGSSCRRTDEEAETPDESVDEKRDGTKQFRAACVVQPPSEHGLHVRVRPAGNVFV